ncbi:MAG: GntR family transcriptional regulator [Gudongella sp.]|nr:GntR family transcriptional regulator [Gudongella sp.]
MGDNKMQAEEIYEILKDRIIHLHYEPGQVLNEIDLADEFGISRTPIRRVFQMLMSDKLLNIIPRFGAQVAPMDFRKMKSVFEVTRELDAFATKLAVDRISDENIAELEEILDRLNNYDIPTDYQKAIDDDEKFHEIIYSSCDNPWLEEILTRLHYQTERLWHYAENYFDEVELFTDTLGKILDSIKSGNVDDAERYTREHIDQFVMKIKKEML